MAGKSKNLIPLVEALISSIGNTRVIDRTIFQVFTEIREILVHTVSFERRYTDNWQSLSMLTFVLIDCHLECKPTKPAIKSSTLPRASSQGTEINARKQELYKQIL